MFFAFLLQSGAQRNKSIVFLPVVLGYATTIIPHWFTYYGSVVLFVVFGVKMLYEGISMDAQGAQEELEEVQAELKKKDEEVWG